MTEIKRGDWVVAIDARGVELRRRALGGPMRGQNFMVVPVCRPEEWDAAEREGREPDPIPWPAEDVKVRSHSIP
jgi:hypothetical protein